MQYQTMITPLYHLRALNTPCRRLFSASVVPYKASSQRPGDQGQGRKPEVTSDSGSKTLEKLHIKKIPEKTSTPQPTKTPDKTKTLTLHLTKTPNKTPTPQPSKTSDKKLTPQPTKKTSDKTPVRPKDTKTDDVTVTQPLERFFSQYSKFQYQPTKSPVTEFDRLCKEYGLKKEEKTREDVRSKFNIAIKKQFGFLYGSVEKDIANWHKLCHVLRIDPAPNTLEECRKAVRAKHVNLVDLVEGGNVRIFKSEEELGRYTRETEKFFPKEDAVDNEILRALRRHVL